MKTITRRLDRFEQTLEARLGALMESDEELERRCDEMRQVLGYIGLPMQPKDEQIRQWRQSDRRRAEIMLATGCTKPEAVLKGFVEEFSDALTEERARERLLELGEIKRAVSRDMQAGLPGEQSEAGKRLAEMLLSGFGDRK